MIHPMHIEDIREQTDCRHLIERDLGKPHSGGEGSKAWSWRCPMHHETKGYSLTAWKDGWKCWGSCGIGGDAIKWLQVYHGLDFTEACRAFGAPDRAVVRSGSRLYVREIRGSMPKSSEPPREHWQAMGLKVVEEAEQFLWGDNGEKALRYLTVNRGLREQTIRAAHLGYLPGPYADWAHYKLPDGSRYDVPYGIVIPWFIEGELWGIKVRRAAGQPKYMQVAGSNISGDGLYWADNLLAGWPTLFVEGEFDCLIAWQEARDLVCPVTLGAASNRLNCRWYPVLAASPIIFTLYDTDEAGEKGAAALAAITARARRITVPAGKDISEFHLSADADAVAVWLKELLPGYRAPVRESVSIVIEDLPVPETGLGTANPDVPAEAPATNDGDAAQTGETVAIREIKLAIEAPPPPSPEALAALRRIESDRQYRGPLSQSPGLYKPLVDRLNARARGSNHANQSE